MNSDFRRGLTPLTLCLAFALGGCTSGGYYSRAPAPAAHAPSRPYTYPSSGAPYSSGTVDRYTRSNVYPAGTAYLPYSSTYYSYRDYPRGIYYSQTDYYRPYEYYRPYQFYYPYQYYRHRPYKYYRYPPHKKKGRTYRAGKSYRDHYIHRRSRVDGDLGLRGTHRIRQGSGVGGDRRVRSSLGRHQGYRIRGDHRLQPRYRMNGGRRAHHDRRVSGKRHSYPGHPRRGATMGGHRPAAHGRRR